jgi:hypothetical protein
LFFSFRNITPHPHQIQGASEIDYRAEKPRMAKATIGNQRHGDAYIVMKPARLMNVHLLKENVMELNYNQLK